MKAYDFEYDGVVLSSLGFMICKFDANGLETVSNGSQITFNTVSSYGGAKRELTSTTYEETLETTFQICKKPCDNEDTTITIEDVRRIARWLNRKTFKKFRLLTDDMATIYFEASFNISRVEMDGEIVGLELEMFTNSPFALMEKKVAIRNGSNNGKFIIRDLSDVEGFIYPKMTIRVNANGNLVIKNAIEDRTMVINNCKSGEVITIEHPIITSSLSSHKIQNDFNWSFFRIANDFKQNVNEVTVSIPCDIDIVYPSYVKITI